MPTTDSLDFEMQRRVILYKSGTVMPDGSLLGFDGDPNNAGSTDAGERLIFNSAVGTLYVNDNGIMYRKTDTNNTWEAIGSGSGGSGGGSSYTDSDVDSHLNITGASNGEVLSWDGSDYTWVTQASGSNGGGSGGASISTNDTSVTTSDTGSDGEITFTTDGTDRWAITSNGHLLPSTNSSFDIGSAEQKVRHLFLSDNSLKFVDSSNTEYSLSVSDGTLMFQNSPVGSSGGASSGGASNSSAPHQLSVSSYASSYNYINVPLDSANFFNVSPDDLTYNGSQNALIKFNLQASDLSKPHNFSICVQTLPDHNLYETAYEVNGSFVPYSQYVSLNLTNAPSRTKLIEYVAWTETTSLTLKFNANFMNYDEDDIGQNSNGDKFVAPSTDEMVDGNYHVWYVPTESGGVNSNYYTYMYGFGGVASLSYYDSITSAFPTVDLDDITIVSTGSYTDKNGTTHTVVTEFSIDSTVMRVSEDTKPIGSNTEYQENQFNG